MTRRERVKSKYPGFYVHPEHPNLGVSINGELRDLSTGKSLTPSIPKGNTYRHVCINGKSYLHHLLVLSCFEEKPDDGRKWVGNHLDGIKYNNRLNNLEWTTYSGNSIHAYESGLRDDNKPTLVKDLRTGVITRYISLQSAAKAIGCNGGIIHRWMNGKCAAPLQLWYDVTYEGQPWHNLTEKDAGRNPLFTDSILVITPEGNKLRFESMADAASLIRLKPGTLRYRMKNGIHVSNGFMTGWASEYTGDDIGDYEWVRYEPDRSIPRGQRKPLPLEVTFPDGKTEVYQSVGELSERLGITRDALSRSIWRRKGYKDLTIKYIAQ